MRLKSRVSYLIVPSALEPSRGPARRAIPGDPSRSPSVSSRRQIREEGYFGNGTAAVAAGGGSSHTCWAGSPGAGAASTSTAMPGTQASLPAA